MKSATSFRFGCARGVGCAGSRRAAETQRLYTGHRIKLDKRDGHGIMTLIRVDQNIVEMALLGTAAERVIPDTVDCVWRRAGAGDVVNRESAPQLGSLNGRLMIAMLMDAHTAAATAGRQQDTTAGGLQAAWVVRVLVMALGAGSTSAVPQCTHIKNAHQPRPGP